MMLAHAYAGFQPSGAVKEDVARIRTLWGLARHRFSAGGPWLFGDRSLADVFHAPIAARFAAYALVDADDPYVALHLSDPSFRQWRADGLTQTYDPMPHAMDLPHRPWPEVGR